MDTHTSFLHNSPKLPSFFKTLKPISNSISPKINPISPDNSSFQSGIQIRDQNLHKVSMLFANDHDKVPNFDKTLNEGSTSNSRKCSDNDVVMVEGNVCNKTQKKNDVIELRDDDNDDDDCVFVKKEKNLFSRGSDKKDPICVDGYVKEKKIPKLEKKFSIDREKVVHCVDYYDGDDNDEVMIVDTIPVCKKSKRRSFSGVSILEVGESSGTKNWGNDDGVVIEIDDSTVEEMMFMCEICADSKPRKESFTIKGCSHSYCSECMTNYVASKLQDGVSRVSCPVPNCTGVLEPEYCREILPFDVFVRWGNLLCESVILASQKFYCPFNDCSALLVDDGVETVTQAECPSCFRLFCAQCKVGWHHGIECVEFQKLGEGERQKEDIMLRNLAKIQKWQRCPVCKFYVEKSEGCLYMKCRCGIAFCYSCGAVNTDHTYHNCKKCGR